MGKKKAVQKRRPSSQIRGMRGVYLVAAELSRLGFIVSPTSRGAEGADLLVTDRDCRSTYSVQVKTDSRGAFWLVGESANRTVSKSHIYVLVRIRKLKRRTTEENPEGEVIEYYVVPSQRLSKLTSHSGKWTSIQRTNIEKFKDEWKYFGDPNE